MDKDTAKELTDSISSNTEQSEKLLIALTESTRAINEMIVVMRALAEAMTSHGDDD